MSRVTSRQQGRERREGVGGGSSKPYHHVAKHILTTLLIKVVQRKERSNEAVRFYMQVSTCKKQKDSKVEGSLIATYPLFTAEASHRVWKTSMGFV